MKKFNLFVLLAFLLASMNMMAQQATITVYKATDPTTPVAGWDHVASANLRGAVSAAGNDGVVEISSGTLTLSSSFDMPTDVQRVTIKGAGRDQTTITGSTTYYNTTSKPSTGQKCLVRITTAGGNYSFYDMTIDSQGCKNSDFTVMRFNGNVTSPATVSIYNSRISGANAKSTVQVGSSDGKNICHFRAYNCYIAKNGGNAFYANIDVCNNSTFWSTGTYFEGFVEGDAEFDTSVTCYYEYDVTGYYNASGSTQPRKFFASIQNIIDWYDEHHSLQAMLPALNAQDASNAGTILEVMVEDLCDCNTTFCGGTLEDKAALAVEFLRIMDASQSALVSVYGLPAFTTMREKVANVVENGLPECPGVMSQVVARGETVALDYKYGYDSLVVENGAIATVAAGKKISIEHFIMNLKQGESAQFDMADGAKVNIANAEAVITLTDGTLDNTQYYSIAVPFPVNLSSLRLRNATQTVAGTNNGNYRIYRFDGNKRASEGAGWVRIEDTDEVLVPGVGYLMSFSSNRYNQVVLTKTADGKLSNKADLAPTTYVSTEPTDASWNSLANNGLTNIGIEIGKMVDKKWFGMVIGSTWTPTASAKILVLENIEGVNKYVVETANSATLTPGSSFFWQKTDDTFKWVDATENVLMSPARVAAEGESNEICLQLKNSNDDMVDQMFVSISEDATDEYEIGKDLAKMTINAGKVASIYTEAYGTKLAAFDTKMENDMAIVPVMISAPAAATYSLHLPTATEMNVLLTYNGEIVANMTEGDYQAALNAGDNEGYALMLIRNKNNVTTDIIDNVNASKATKVVSNGHLYIYVGDRAYDAQGHTVK